MSTIDDDQRLMRDVFEAIVRPRSGAEQQLLTARLVNMFVAVLSETISRLTQELAAATRELDRIANDERIEGDGMHSFEMQHAEALARLADYRAKEDRFNFEVEENKRLRADLEHLRGEMAAQQRVQSDFQRYANELVERARAAEKELREKA